MLSHALRTRQHTSICRLQLHQRFNRTLKSTSTSNLEEDTRTPVHFEKQTSRSAFIRTWEPFHNLADAWALLRVVERKYGKVAEAHFLKDYEIKNRYQVFTYVVFRNQESIQRIPKTGQSFHIPAPIIEDKPGGLGLDDIRHLLHITDRDVSFEFPSAASPEMKESKERVIGARIERADKDFYTLPKTEKSSRPNIPLARLFSRWGGFHELETMERSKDITESEWFGRPELEQVRMRAALQWCSQITGFPNPAVIRKPTARENDEKASNSSPASMSMDSSESRSSSPVTLDIPISEESTSTSTQSPSLLPEESLQSPSQPSSQPSPEPTQPPSEPILAPTTPPPGQLTPEQVLAKKAMQRQMSRARQLMVKTKRPVAKKEQKPEEETPENQMPHVLDEFPEESPPPQPKGVIASIWKLFGR